MKRPLLAILLASAASLACDRNQNDRPDAGADPYEPARQSAADQTNANMHEAEKRNEREERAEAKREASELVQKATVTLGKMKKDESLKKLLGDAKGVFLVPEFGRAAAGVGVRGGEGVLIARREGKGWSDPAFYNVGGISLGAQLGGEGGEIAMILMSDDALKPFKNKNSFSLDAGAGVTMVDYSSLAQASTGRDVGNVVFWSSTKGAFVGVNLGASDINWDEEENSAYYGATATPEEALSRAGSAPKGKLQEELTGI